jgi:hypothetical protein
MDGQDVQDIFLQEKERRPVARKRAPSMSYLCVGSEPGCILLPSILLPSSSSVELVVEHSLALARAE